MPIDYKLLLLDLDGTLIGKDSQVSPRVFAAVGEVSKRLQVSIATGREPSDVVRFARHLGLSGPQMCDNGAMLLDPATGTALWSRPLGRLVAGDIIARLGEMPLDIIATHPGGTVTGLTDAKGLDLTRVSALDLDEERADSLVADFGDMPQVDAVKVFLPYNDLWAVDLTRASVNKATATRKLAEIAGAEQSELIAAGDSYNDLPMLRAAGLRIAMADAPEELKAIADYTAPPVEEDGLAVAIEEFVLPRLERGG